MEIVTGPTMEGGLEASCFVDELLCVLRDVGAVQARADRELLFLTYFDKHCDICGLVRQKPQN